MIRRVLLLSLVGLAVAGAAAACPVCVGETDSQMARGTNNAVLFMLAIVGLVQVGLVALFISVRRRAKDLEHRREQFSLIEGGVR